MEAIIEDLKKIVRFKSTTDVGDIVLVVAEEPKSMIYALVTDFQRDESKRDEWWHVSLQILSVPPQKVTWTLRTSQFNGQEIFTMGGEKRFFQAVIIGREPAAEKESPKGPKSSSQKGSLKRIK